MFTTNGVRMQIAGVRAGHLDPAHNGNRRPGRRVGFRLFALPVPAGKELMRGTRQSGWSYTRSKSGLRIKAAEVGTVDTPSAESMDSDDSDISHYDSGYEPLARVKFSIHRDMEFGQNLVLVGGHPVLGDWNINEGVPLDWVEGNRWEVEMELPQLELIEYKYAVRCGWHDSAPIIWSGGPNCLLATNQCSHIFVQDKWVSQEEWWCGDDEPNAVAAREAAQMYQKCNPRPRKSRVQEPTTVPDWAREAVFYAIYPLGAFKAPFQNDLVSPPVPRLAEIRKQYDHLESLGVTAVYFSPLFESETHGYDTVDYFQIDRRLGDIKLFKEIVAELHQRGIRVVLDGVFNHTGRQHQAFQQIQQKGPALSEYSNWYSIGASPDDYEGWCVVDYGERNSGFWAGSGFAYDCWEGHPQLPQLNHAEQSVRNYIFEVARFWLQDIGVDGWRLDVAHEISPDFWREFRQVCMAVKPDCLLVGEMIHGNYRGWVGPDRLHSGTNYQLSRSLWSSLVEDNYDEMFTALQRENKLYGGLTLLNFVSNHDVIRLASVVKKREHCLLATGALLMLHGIPCIYYGDEYGVEGIPGAGTDEFSGGDDALRGPMLDPDDPTMWPQMGEEMLDATKRLVKLRKENPAFSRGVLDVDGIEYGSNYMVFSRTAEDQTGVVVFNSADWPVDPWPEVAVPAEDGSIFMDVWSEDKAIFKVFAGKVYVGPMEPNSMRILLGPIALEDLPPELREEEEKVEGDGTSATTAASSSMGTSSALPPPPPPPPPYTPIDKDAFGVPTGQAPTYPKEGF